MSTTARRSVASSLERLGTETAFSVLARAKALEREGRDVIHLEIGEPDFSTPLHICDVAAEALRAGETHYCPSAGIPELREAAAEYLVGDPRSRRRPGERPRRNRCEAVPLLRHPRHLQPGRRGRLSRSRLPDLRVGDPLGWGDAGSAAAPRGARLHVLARGSRRAPRAEDEARHPQLAPEPDRWSAVDARTSRAPPR